MAGTAIYQQSDVNYFPLKPPAIPQQNNTFSAPQFLWKQGPYTNAQLPSLEFCDSGDSSFSSPISSTTATYSNLCNLPKANFDEGTKPNRIFDLSSFDDWVGWDSLSQNEQSPITTDFFPKLKKEPPSPNIEHMALQETIRSHRNSRLGNSVEDAAAVFGDDQIEGHLFQSPSACRSDRVRDNSYSTSRTWAAPPAKPVPQNSRSYNLTPALAPEEQLRLIAQAMPSRSRKSPSPSLASTPDPEPSNGRKRKSTSYISDDEDKDSHSPQPSKNGRSPPVKKTAHNVIEKRYRTNLNDKIIALKESVPSLRFIANGASKSREASRHLQSPTSNHKLNKATILSKAAEYISHLERSNKVLVKENEVLKSRVEAFGVLIMSRESEQHHCQEPPQAQQQQMRNERSQSHQIKNNFRVARRSCHTHAPPENSNQ